MIVLLVMKEPRFDCEIYGCVKSDQFLAMTDLNQVFGDRLLVH